MRQKTLLPVIVFLLALFVTFGTNTAGAAESDAFKDVQDHWAKEYIKQLVDYGIIAGYPDNTFRPNDTITRAEFVKMVVQAELTNPDDLATSINPKQLSKGVPTPFKDTAGHWVAKQGYLQQAIAWKWVKPAEYSGQYFQPDKNIERVEMARILARAIGAGNSSIYKDAELEFSDQDKITEEFRGYVKVAVEKKLINGYPEDGTFRPNTTATRAEASKMVSKRFEATYTLACYKHHDGEITLPKVHFAVEASSAANTASLVISVHPAKNDNPLNPTGVADAVVTLQPGGLTAVTDDEGYALFKNVPVGVYNLTIEADGYETYREDNKVPVTTRASNAAQVFLFSAATGKPEAKIALRSDNQEVPYNIPVAIDTSASNNVSRQGFHWEIIDQDGKVLEDPYADIETPLQLEASTLPGDNPYIFTFTPPAPGDYTVRLHLRNELYPGEVNTDEITIQAVNVTPEAYPAVVPGPAPLQKNQIVSKSSSSGLQVVNAGERVYLRGWAVDKNLPSPALYNPGGNESNQYGKNNDHFQRQFKWQWKLTYRSPANGEWEDVSQLLQAEAGPGTEAQYPYFAAENAGTYQAVLVVSDADSSGALVSEPSVVDILVVANGEVAESTCQSCHGDKKAGVMMTAHGKASGLETPSCQSCHGPGEKHVSSPKDEKVATISVTYRSGLCGQCHQQYGQSQKARHTDADSYGFEEINSALLLNCTGCHYAKGHAQRTELAASQGKAFHEVNFSPLDKDKLPAKNEAGITCVTCHDPHPEDSNRVIRDETGSETCNTCHYEKWQNVILNGRSGEFRNGYEYPGENYEFDNPHFTEDRCVTCHMDTTNKAVDADGVRLVGGHTLRMRDAGANGVLGGFGPRSDDPNRMRNPNETDDVMNLAPCEKCHEDGADFNRNNLQERIFEKWQQLGQLLRERNNGKLPQFKPGDKCATCHRGGTLPFVDDPNFVLENAYTNYKLIKNDRSWGIHNPQYVEKLLDDSIRSVLEDFKQ